jgi:hypothetical protein
MTTLKDAQRAVQQTLGTKQNAIQWKAAVMGDGHGTVSAGNNMVYVRLSENSSVIEVLNLRCAPVDGLRVRIAKTPEMPLVWQVIGQDDQRADESGNTGGGVNYNIGPHHATHEYLGADQVNIDWRQITALRVYRSSSMAAFTIGVLPGLLPRPGADLVVAQQTLDLTASIPVSGALWVLISINSLGAIVATDGATAASILALTLGDIPDTPIGNFRIAAVRLYVGQTAIHESTASNDIRDLRFPQERLAGDPYEQFGVQDANEVLAGPATGADAVPTFRALVNADLPSSVIYGTGTSPRIAQFSGVQTIADSTLIKTGAGVLTLDSAGAYTLTVPATGTALLRDANIAAGRVAFGIDANTVSGDAALYWDNTNKRLGINKTPGTFESLVILKSGADRSWSVNDSENDVRNIIIRQSADENGPIWDSQKSRGTRASKAIVANGDDLGLFRFLGYDGSAFVQAGYMLFEVDGVPALNSMPGRITFWTTPSGSTTPAERMRITTAGNIGIGATPTARLHVVGNSDIVQGLIVGHTTQAVATPLVQFTRADAAAGVSSMLGLTGLGSGANGDGVAQTFAAKSSTTAAQQQAMVSTLWIDATHATRKAALKLYAYDTAARLGLTIEADGAAADVYFEGGAGSGLPYGSCYGNEIGWTQASAAQNTWYLISDADMADGHGGLNLVTHDGSGKLTVTKAGRYLINYGASVECSALNKHVQTGIAVNGTVIGDGQQHYEVSSPNAQLTLGSTAIVVLAASGYIEIAMRTTDTGTPDLSVDHLNISIVQIGG